MGIEKIIDKIAEDDPLRLFIRKYMAEHPEEDDLSIHPDRGTFGERHKGLVRAIDVSLESRQFKAERDYSSKDIYRIINEEQERRQKNYNK